MEVNEPPPSPSDLAALAAGLTVVRTAGGVVDSLGDNGWQIADDFRAVQLTSPSLLDIERGLADIDRLMPCALSCDLISDRGFTLTLVAGRFQVTGRPDDLTYQFEAEMLETAQQASDGDADAARRLPGSWTVSLTIDLATPLQDAHPALTWHVARSKDWLLGALLGTPWWAAKGVLGSLSRPSAHVVLDAEGLLSYPTWLICGIDAIALDVLNLGDLKGLQSKLEKVRSATGMRPDLDIPLPDELTVEVAGPGWEPFVDLIAGWAAAAAWAWISGSLELPGDGEARASLFGFRALNISLPAVGLPGGDDRSDILALYRWATNEESVDRLLAVRQVASLYEGVTALANAAAIRRGAEPVYQGLRSRAVAEVLRAQRDAISLAIQAARSTAEAVLSGTKAVAERTLAALAGIGGLVLARSTSATTPGLAERLSFGVAVFLVALAAWSALVEGPTLGVPLASLSDDLKGIGALLTPRMRDEIEHLRSVTLARRRALISRIVSPIAYLGVAAISLTFSRPYPHWLWH